MNIVHFIYCTFIHMDAILGCSRVAGDKWFWRELNAVNKSNYVLMARNYGEVAFKTNKYIDHVAQLLLQQWQAVIRLSHQTLNQLSVWRKMLGCEVTDICLGLGSAGRCAVIERPVRRHCSSIG